MSVSLLFAGGGSGGHVFPLLAIAEAVRSIEPGAQITFVGTAQGMETQILPKRGERLELLDVLPIKGMGLAGALRGVGQAARALPSSRDLVRKLSPDAVLSIGGYAAGPVSLAARSLGVPVTLLEPNSVPGLSNRLLSPFVDRAYIVFPEVARFFRPSVVRRLGLPLRPGFSPRAYAPRSTPPRVLVIGGSQGAQALNERVPEALAMLAGKHRFEVLHQAGRGKDEEVQRRYEASGLATWAKVSAFIDDMPTELSAADVIISRAGAGAMAEICAIGRAAVFVPFPFAADDHQRKNAEALARAGACVSVAQQDATPERLAAEIERLVASAEARTTMAHAAEARGEPEAARLIAQDLLALAGERRTELKMAVGF